MDEYQPTGLTDEYGHTPSIYVTHPHLHQYLCVSCYHWCYMLPLVLHIITGVSCYHWCYMSPLVLHLLPMVFYACYISTPSVESLAFTFAYRCGLTLQYTPENHTTIYTHTRYKTDWVLSFFFFTVT